MKSEKGAAVALPTESGRNFHLARKCSFLLLHAQSYAVVAMLISGGLMLGCGRGIGAQIPSPSLDQLSRSYVRLAVGLGERDADSIDYYVGPAKLVSNVRSHPPSLAQIRISALQLIGYLDEVPLESSNDRQRREFLRRQLQAIAGRAGLLLGAHPSFDRETEQFFGMRVPAQADQHHLAAVRSELDLLLPGRGNLAQRYAAYDAQFTIPSRRLPAVMSRALQGCRAKTLAHVFMPAGEQVEVQYVSNKPWSAFSRYQGNFHSLIEINTDFPLTVDRALQLACHEAYPGHHTYNSIRDMQLVRARHLTEFMVQPTFSPQSLASEAAATFAIDVAFPGTERAAFERSQLFPLAGLNAEKAGRYCRIERLVDQLHTVEPSIARDYLDGKLEFVRAGWALESQALMAHSDATLKYINEYRSYMTTYTYGRDLMAEAVDRNLGPSGSDDLRWRRFFDIMTSLAPLPRLEQESVANTGSLQAIRGQAAATLGSSSAKKL